MQRCKIQIQLAMGTDELIQAVTGKTNKTETSMKKFLFFNGGEKDKFVTDVTKLPLVISLSSCFHFECPVECSAHT